MKKTYTQPTFMEYGRLDQLTLGTSGNKPDLIAQPLSGGGYQLINTNTNCDATSNKVYACLIVGT